MRSATLFLIAILTPCAALCWMAWHSMKDEAREIQTQRTAFYQQAADNAARAAGEFMTGQLRTFSETVDRLLAAESPAELRAHFHQSIRNAWPLAEAGLALDTASGRLLPQTEPSEPQVTAFVAHEAWFFQDEPQMFFLEIPSPDPSSIQRKPRLSVHSEKAAGERSITDALHELAQDAPSPPGVPATALPAPAAAPEPPGAAAEEPSHRMVLAQKDTTGAQSQVKPVRTTLAAFIARDEAGIASVPRDNGLFTFIWYRPPDLPGITFAAAIEPPALRAALAWHQPIAAPDDDTCLAILDHTGQPAAQWTTGATFTPQSWTSPLTSREIGAALPRWEAAVFLRDPAVFTKAASGARWRLGIIVTASILVAITGALFILRDARRSARDARLKTDFVSNVSHELKTPLTSIRMFSDLLGSNPAAPPDKTRRYAEVIATEAARLTRLINNVLNFSRMEGGREELQTAPLDLRALTLETVEHIRPQLERDGFAIHLALPDDPVMIKGDADALSQVLLNLLSNAGKYGHNENGPHEITVSLTASEHVTLSVADRGRGVPRGQERRIFEKFQRAHNTLASGTAGSGLGLTIARRLAEAHSGTLEYSPRDGGGAQFSVRIKAG